jgi:hypothetical protein
VGRHVYNVVKAPIGWSLFCNRERIGGYVSNEAALEGQRHSAQRLFERVTAFRSTCRDRRCTKSKTSNRGRRGGASI